MGSPTLLFPLRWWPMGRLTGREGRRSRGYNRTKGHTFERKCAEELRHIFPKARRLLEYHGEDCNGVDLLHTGRYKFQCKKKKGYVSVNTIKEIGHDASLNEVPILITAPDDGQAMAVLPWADLLVLLEDFERPRSHRK